MVNAHHDPILFRLPSKETGERWERLLDTADQQWERRYLLRDHGYKLQGRSVVVLRLSRAQMNPGGSSTKQAAQ